MSVNATEFSVTEAIAAQDHEQVLFCNDRETGLKAIIAIHNSVLGPALGGTRFWNYNNDREAITDVLRLSRGMSFKASLAGLNLGGGKAVIMGDPKKIKNEFLMRRFGKFVNNLAGKYITAEDVGVDVRDMQHIRVETPHVTGIPKEMGGSGDPSPVTAFGVYMSMKACLKFQTGNESLEGKRIVVQGVGKVGMYLVERLRKENAKVFIYDINEESVKHVAGTYGCEVIAPELIAGFDADIYAPCALGAGLNPDTIPQFKYSLICGGANNQLLEEKRDGEALKARGILYSPDFMANAGGLINVATELEGYDESRAYNKATGIYDTTMQVLTAARDLNITTHEAALRVAENRIASVGKIRQYR